MLTRRRQRSKGLERGLNWLLFFRTGLLGARLLLGPILVFDGDGSLRKRNMELTVRD